MPPKSTQYLAIAALMAITAGCANLDTRVSAYGYTVYGQLGEKVGAGRLELTETAGQASVRITTDQVKVSPCLQARLNAHVWRDETTTTIITEPASGVCEPYMYVIRNDGGGGKQYTQVLGAWAQETLNQDLTPRPIDPPIQIQYYGN